MTATPITEKFHPSEPICGLPAVNKVHNADDLLHTHFLANVGQVVDVKSARGTQFGRAMLVTVPNTVKKGQILAIDLTDFSASVADGSVDTIFGVCMADADTTNVNASAYYAWVMVEGRCTALVAAGLAVGADVYVDAATPGTLLAAGAVQINNIQTTSAVASAANTPATHDNLPELQIGFAEVYVTR